MRIPALNRIGARSLSPISLRRMKEVNGMGSQSIVEMAPRREDEFAVEVFATAPQSKDWDKSEYLKRVADVARWSEEAGCAGILVYTDNSIADPWLVGQIIIQSTERLSPLVAIQPVYMHPYSVAKMISTYGFLHNRRIYLNMVAGGFANDLTAMGDRTPHDRRYDRLVEYTLIIKQLLAGAGPVKFTGAFYQTDNLRLAPKLPDELFPGVFVSGSSEAGLAAARAIGAVAVQYPGPVGEYEKSPPPADLSCGARVGVIAREDADEAWRVAHDRFPTDRRGQLAHQLAMKVSDSVWHKQLSEIGEETGAEMAARMGAESGGRTAGDRNPYWLAPFENYKTNCPYLVGSYERVARELASYIAVGYRTLILDIPPNQEELAHINLVLTRARREAQNGRVVTTVNNQAGGAAS
jgi:alkanesulfonate monooxygenase